MTEHEDVAPALAALQAASFEPRPEFVAELRDVVHRQAASSADSPIVGNHDLGEPVMITLETEQAHTAEQDRASKRRWRRPAVAMVAAAIVLVLGAGVVTVVSLQDDGNTPADTAQSFGEESALASAVAFFDAYNSGDEELQLALLTSNGTVRDNFAGEWVLEEWTWLQAWNAAQGSVVTTPRCDANAAVDGLSVTVTCDTESQDALVQAVGSPGVATEVTMLVTPDGIADLAYRYGFPDFGDVGEPFDQWMRQQHPDEADFVGSGWGSSITEARQVGARLKELAQEWGGYLDANNCTYKDGC